jgi:trk system potassium uptake protein TrkA
VYSSDLLVIVGPHASYAEARRKILLEENDHSVFVIGGGDVGGELALLLAQDGLSVTVIEISRSRCETLANAYPHIQIVHGDGTNVLALTDEHLERGRALFAVTKADEVNLMSSLLAKDLGVPLTYSLVHRPDYATVYEKLGVTATTGAHHMLYRTVDWINSKASVMQSLPLAVPNLEISEVYIRAASELAGHLVSDLSLPHGAKLIGGFINGAYFDGDSNPKFEHQGYYLFVGPKGLGSLLDERLSKLR